MRIRGVEEEKDTNGKTKGQWVRKTGITLKEKHREGEKDGGGNNNTKRVRKTET